MSGKSTLLRAVGINALLSQTIYTSLSRMYRGNFYKLMTSIGRSDNVISGDSYYLVEAKALKRILETLDEETPILCIVDEIFRGTNSLERIAASAEVLRYLAGVNCLLVAATHDLELTELLDEELHNFHFKETVDEKGLNFDYQLRIGPSTTRNAINLLDYLGYPEEILQGARKTIAKMENATTIPLMEIKKGT
jgi:DNA mismatch repair ATPase MutS